MTVIKIDSFMQYANFFYKLAGIEPYKRVSQSAFSFVVSWIIYWANIGNLTIVLLGFSIFIFNAFATGVQVLEAIMALSYTGFAVVGASKLVVVWLKKPQLRALVAEMEELYPSTEELQRSYELPRYLRICSRLSLSFSLLYSTLIWTYNLFGVGQYLIYERWLKTRVVGKNVPYYMYTPWRWQGHWSYYYVLFSQIFAGYTSAVGQMSTDLLLCAMVTQLIMHFDYLARTIEQHRLIGSWKKDGLQLGEFAVYHERLLRLTATINDIFGVPLLLNFMISCFVICFVGFQMTVGGDADVMAKLLMFLVSSLCQVYLICYYGQILEDASSGISSAAYNQYWHRGDVYYRRALVFMIARGQKPTYLTATVFMRINKNTMTSLLQLSYKFFALLRTMYSN